MKFVKITLLLFWLNGVLAENSCIFDKYEDTKLREALIYLDSIDFRREGLLEQKQCLPDWYSCDLTVTVVQILVGMFMA